MFRRLSSSLPKEFEYPADLEKLGYYLNENDQIRSIARPDQEFNYFISKNEHLCNVQREAMNTCIRRILHDRFLLSSLTITRLPINASPSDPHVPILTSSNLSAAKRIILFFGEAVQDLGIFAYRTMGQESNAAGSALDFVHSIQASKDSPGIVIANMGQLIWYRRGQRAVTQQTWNALPRKTAVSGPMRIDDKKNRVPGNEDVAAHVQSVFEAVGRLARKDAAIDVIGLSDGAWKVVAFLQANWETWKRRVDAIAIGTSSVYPGYELWHENFARFWGKRARAYLISSEPVDKPLTGREDFGCNCYSSGSAVHEEVIMPRAHKSMLSFFQLVADVPGYQEIEQLGLGVDDNEAREVQWVEGDDEAAGLGPSIVISKAKQASH